MLQILLWLLRRDLVLQLGRYVSLLIPDPPGTAVSTAVEAVGGTGIGASTAITRKRSGESAFGGSSGGTFDSEGGSSAARAWEGYGYDNSFSSTGSSSVLAQRARLPGGSRDGLAEVEGSRAIGGLESPPPLKPFEGFCVDSTNVFLSCSVRVFVCIGCVFLVCLVCFCRAGAG